MPDFIKKNISFEFFPPKTDVMEQQLWSAIEALKGLCPKFVSVTYGAGGSTRDRTHNIIYKILEKTNLVPASHLTCVGSSAHEIQNIANNYWQKGVKHIVALRGDLPEGYIHPDDGYNNAWELVAALKSLHDFEISVAGYPEMHPKAKSMEEDLNNLKLKVDAGASRVITQFFFDNNKYYEFLNKVEQLNIDAEIVPGILPINNFEQVVKFADSCNSSIPSKYFRLFDGINDKDELKKISTDLAIEQCLDLQKNNVTNFHFYTLNKSEMILAICKALKL
jgi:methylenetetrahydrofolate reductase (NADPH)